ncbi:unnamed protein product, partial [Urochloa humidicola]
GRLAAMVLGPRRNGLFVSFFFLSMQSCIWRGPRLFWRQLRHLLVCFGGSCEGKEGRLVVLRGQVILHVLRV